MNSRSVVSYDALSPVDQEGVAQLLADLGTRLLNNKVVGLNVEFEVSHDYADIRFGEDPMDFAFTDSGSFVVSVRFTLPGPLPSPAVQIPIPGHGRAVLSRRVPVNDSTPEPSTPGRHY